MNKFVKYVTEWKIPLLVVVSPKYGAENSNEQQPIKDICYNQNVPFWDYYADSEFMKHKEWYKESMHQNDDGAKVLTKQLISTVEFYFSFWD